MTLGRPSVLFFVDSKGQTSPSHESTDLKKMPILQGVIKAYSWGLSWVSKDQFDNTNPGQVEISSELDCFQSDTK